MRQPMMHDGVLAAGNARQLLIPFSNGSKAFVDVDTRQRNIPLLPELLYTHREFAIQATGFGVFLFV
jgi:hypothetical protein